MDQSNRYADLSLDEDTLIAEGKHILVTYTMTPAEGYGYLSTAAHFAAESSTGTNVEVSTTDDFTKDLDAMVYEIDEANGIMKIAYPNDLFDRNINLDTCNQTFCFQYIFRTRISYLKNGS